MVDIFEMQISERLWRPFVGLPVKLYVAPEIVL